MVRYRTVRTLAALAGVALVAVGCTSTPPPPVPAEGTTSSTPTAHTPSQIVIGVDDVDGGYNPHNLADLGQVTSAFAQLLLPSVFRPDDRGAPRLDETVMRSARVIKEQPFTVAYRIRRDAAWSDGAPIAAENFSYLAGAMRTEPGTVNPAGYRLITDIASREGGKRVEVTFARHYPGWRSLFADLLPSHLLKDTPGGWQRALQNSFPAYGGPFSIKTMDTARGEVLLERNERYWEKPAAVDQLVLRRTERAGLVDGLRSGSTQVAMTRASASESRALEGLGDSVESHTVARPEVAEVLLRPWSAALGDKDTRAAIAALLDRPRLIAAGTEGGPSASMPADAQLLAPSEREYTPSVPPRWRAADPARAHRLLTSAGYTRSGGRWRDASGQPLRLVIASPGEREPYAGIAAELARQLVQAGVDARTITPEPRALFGTSLDRPRAETGEDGEDGEPPAEPTETETDGEQGERSAEVDVDIVVTPRAIGADPASDLASRFGCAQQPDGEPVEETEEPERPVNPAGFCDRRLQPAITAALTGATPTSEASRVLEPALWRANVAIPLFQVTDTLALGDGVSGITPGPPLSGPFGSAVNWIRTSR